MNQRIKQFERDSGLEIYGLGQDRVKWKSVVEKFAQLIVAECIAELESVKVNEYRTDVYDICYDDGLTQAVETIKEHFGVKE